MAHPLRLVAVTHGAPSAANREAVIRLVDAVASERPELDVSISFVDASNADVAAALAADAEPDAVIVPLVLSAGFHVRTGLSLGLDRIGGGAQLAAELGPDDRIVSVLADRLDALGLADGDAVLLAAAGSNDPRAVRECFETARRLGHRLGRPVTVGFIAAAIPRLPDAIEMIREVHPGARVVVGPYLLAPGHVLRRGIRRRRRSHRRAAAGARRARAVASSSSSSSSATPTSTRSAANAA